MIRHEKLADNFGRDFPYLRLSVTDMCNFRCTYCLPDGYQKTEDMRFLSIDELQRLVRTFAALGTWKIRLTGGEPTLRKDFIDIVHMINETDGIDHIACTTNGYKLPQKAQSFYDAGMRAINISIDSLDPKKFHNITGHKRLAEVLDGIEACRDAGFKKIKLNTVLLRHFNDCELDQFIEFVATRDISLRFIELMQMKDNKAYFDKHHLPGTLVENKLRLRGWQKEERKAGDGPAQEFSCKDSQGRIGIIAPYSKDFCKSCNRLRVSAKGDLHLCLFGELGYSLRSYLQSDDQTDELIAKIQDLLKFKRAAHALHDGNTGVREHLASIGG